jgi:hypothetical protein
MQASVESSSWLIYKDLQREISKYSRLRHGEARSMWTAFIIYTASAAAMACLATVCEWLAEHEQARRARAEAERQARGKDRGESTHRGYEPAWRCSAGQDES